MEKIEIRITAKDRDLIMDYTFAGDDLTRRLKVAEVNGRYLQVKYTIDELDELVDYIAAESNHAEDTKLQKRLDKLYDKLNRIVEKYNE